MMDESKCSEWHGHPLQGKLEDGLQTTVDRTAVLCSIAISLKRIADCLQTYDKYGMTGSASLAQSIVDGLKIMTDIKTQTTQRKENVATLPNDTAKVTQATTESFWWITTSFPLWLIMCALAGMEVRHILGGNP